MLLVYNLGIWFYGALILLASPFNKKAKQFTTGRRKTFPHLKKSCESTSGKLVWIHCASLGEFEQGRPLIEKIKKDSPKTIILLTFFSPSGYEVRKNYNQADIISYLPLDTAKNAHKFISIAKPDAVFFVKYEWWYHYSKLLKDRKTPLYSISSIFRPNQPFFKTNNKLHKSILSHFTHFFVQNSQSKELLSSIGFENTTVTGDTRFDRVAEICAHKKELAKIATFTKNHFTLVIGSSWPKDLEVIAPVLRKYHEIKVIVAPHELHEKTLKSAELYFENKSIRYSKISTPEWVDSKMLLIDNMGMLSSIYQYANIAYIGGGFGKGLHNTLEAATFGMPILFGPNYTRFQEARDLIERGAAFSISNSASFEERFDKLYQDKSALNYASQMSTSYVNENIGATDKILKSSQWKG